MRMQLDINLEIEGKRDMNSINTYYLTYFESMD